jgi:hypothetical protein
MSLLAAGIAVITRNPIAPLAVLISWVLIGSHLLSIIGATKAIAKFSPDQAGVQLLTIHVSRGSLSPVAGLLVLLAWVAVAQAGGYILHQVRDA